MQEVFSWKNFACHCRFSYIGAHKYIKQTLSNNNGDNDELDKSRIFNLVGVFPMTTDALLLEEAGMNEQLGALYEEKELLERSLGTSIPEEIIAMVQSMSEQLSALYAEIG